MKILSHRGYWGTNRAPNSLEAFEASFSLGFGTETDLRDHCGRLVIAHDPPVGEQVIAVEAMLACHKALAPDAPLALNIKADGLQPLLEPLLARFGVKHCFLFDMSVPDTVRSLSRGLPCFTRQSDLETDPVLVDRCNGVWMDAFADDAWITIAVIDGHLAAGRQVCLVSPELHGRDPQGLWMRLRGEGISRRHGVMLCTDQPEEASEFFLT